VSNANALGVLASVIILVTLFEMLRRHRLREKYALVWFLIAVASLAASLLPGAVEQVADVLGVVLPVNLLFFGGSLVLLAMSLQHSYELGRLEERTRTLAEEVALLRLRVDQQQRDEPSQRQPDQP
jgi:hypothetical protein